MIITLKKFLNHMKKFLLKLLMIKILLIIYKIGPIYL